MYRKKISVAPAALILSMCLSCYACGSGSNGSSDSISASRQLLAKNVLLRSANASSLQEKSVNKEVDTATTVTADNVLIDTSGNSLNSTNLQDALDKEMAINLSNILPGTVWTITNKTTDTAHKGCPTGRVTFSNNTLTVDQGSFAAAGLVHDNSCSTIPPPTLPKTPIAYEVLQNSVIYVSWGDDFGDRGSCITIFARDVNTLSMVGDGGYGQQGVSRISILMKVQ